MDPQNSDKTQPHAPSILSGQMIRIAPFLDSTVHVFWGGDQQIADTDSYVPPTTWVKPGALLRVPRVVRFVYDNWSHKLTDPADDTAFPDILPPYEIGAIEVDADFVYGFDSGLGIWIYKAASVLDLANVGESPGVIGGFTVDLIKLFIQVSRGSGATVYDDGHGNIRYGESFHYQNDFRVTPKMQVF